jgi:glycosyltransferase involved in cell wall biosynthesis/SAM-dependent methyltransferase
VRVLLVEFSSVVSGAERSLLELVHGLRGEHEPALACPAGPLADRARELGLEVLSIPGTQLTFRLHPWHTPIGLASMTNAALRLRAIVRERRPDIVHANSTRAGLLAIPAARGISPVVVHCRDALPDGPAGRGVARALLSGADGLVAISRHVAKMLAGPGWAGRRVAVVDNAIDLGRFDPAALPGAAACRSSLGLKPGLLLSVIAQITPWKGQDLAIDTLAELRRRGCDAQLLVVGETKFFGPSTSLDNRAFERGLHALVDAHAIGDHVRFLGEREDAELILAASDVLLVPSTQEPFGRTIVEAMAMGVPVASTSIGGPPEIMRGGIGGLLVEGRDPATWADAVMALSAWPAERGAAARAEARARFSRERHTSAVLDVYAGALAHHSRSVVRPWRRACATLGPSMSVAAPSRDDLGYLEDRWEREQISRDDLAAQLHPHALPASAPPHYDEAVLAAAGIGSGTRVLDLGCGQGDLTLTLLDRGAAVTSLDLSGGMLDVARRRVERFAGGRTAEFVEAPVEKTGLPPGSFDVVVGRFILHHVDLRPAAAELARILAPGGRAVFLENSGANPMLNFARDHIAGRFGIPRLGTEDERPLVTDDWRILGQSFGYVHGEFPVVDVFELFNRQVFRYRNRVAGSVCRGLDRLIGRTSLRRYSYRVLVVAEK